MMASQITQIRQCCTLFVLLLVLPGSTMALNWESCKDPLGMESRMIADADITATSSHDVKSVGPQNARVRLDLEAGAWCPRGQINRESKEYIQVNLRKMNVISALETQGRWDNGKGVEYTEWYMISYWRPGLKDWVRYRNSSKKYIFKGNTNTYTAVKQVLVPSIIASKIRVIPYSLHPRVCCLRLEVYGCPWTDGVLSYRIPRAYRWKSGVDLSDLTYDGVVGDTHYYGGLGQLTDGFYATEYLNLVSNSYEWVGWKNETQTKKRMLDMEFQFDAVRNFSSVTIHVSNAFKSDVKVFSQFKAAFSIGGKYYYKSEDIKYDYMSDTFLDRSRNITINLSNRIGKFVTVSMKYASNWILISEFSFKSVKIAGSIVEERDPKNKGKKPGKTSEVLTGGAATKDLEVPGKSSSKTSNLYSDGILSYFIPKGSSWKSGLSMIDKTFNGTHDDKYFYDGLGQLMDGKYGTEVLDLDAKGYEWIGWKNVTKHKIRTLDLIFQFKNVRNFTSITLHISNAFKKDIMIFSDAEITFSIDGIHYDPTSVTYNYMPDTFLENSRNVTIKLKHHIGLYVKVSLRFAARWILISEILFQSSSANASDGSLLFPPGGTQPSLPPVREKTEVSGQLMGVIIVVMIAFIVLLMIVIIIIVLRFKSRKQTAHTVLHPVEKQITNGIKELRMNMHFVPKSSTPSQSASEAQITANGDLIEKDIYAQPHNINPLVNSSFKRNGKIDGSVNGCCNYPYADSTTSGDYAEPDMTTAGVLVSNTGPSPPIPPTPASLISFLPNGITTCHSKKSSASPSPAHQTAQQQHILHHQQHNISYSPKPSPQHSFTTSKPSSISMPSPAPFGHPQSSSSPAASISDHYYASTDLIKQPSGLQGVCGSSVYFRQDMDAKLADDQPIVVPEFHRDRLNFIAKIGEGQYGEIHLCEAEIISEHPSQAKSQLFAVKALRPMVPERARADFWREAKSLSILQDDNLVRVLGVCTQEDPPLLLLEYGENGDLKTFLKNNEITTNFSISIDENAKLINYGALLYMATQIASGMSHLESMNFIHRDLAARNCLVGNGYSIKISDFGMSNEKYKEDYFVVDGSPCAVPIRWMAWESVIMSKFSGKSDVWAFAVTFWEILTCGKMRPFEDQSNDCVLENMRHYQNNGFYSRLSVFLPQPVNCHKEIYDLMCECWQWREGDRPNFREIHLFLQRKNLGYAPVNK